MARAARTAASGRSCRRRRAGDRPDLASKLVTAAASDIDVVGQRVYARS